jgi:2-octaprenylphenol hydroxylase
MSRSCATFDVVIVGAGLVGATIACGLAQNPSARRLRIAVIEAGSEVPKPAQEQFDPRVVALTLTSQRLLEQIHCWDTITALRACPFHDMSVWDGEGTAQADFSSTEAHTPYLGHIVENSVAVYAVRARLKDLPQITVLQPAKVVAVDRPDAHQQVRLLLDDDTEIMTPLVIAADGAQSTVRELSQFVMREWDYGHQAIVTTVRTERSHEFVAAQRFMATGPLAFLPLRHGEDTHYSSIVWSAETTLAQQLMSLSDADFCARLGAAFEYRLGAIEHSDKRFCLPLRQQHARQYFQPGIVLVGDAAHTIHPLAGQGVNLGLLDAAVLVEEISRALVRQIPLHDQSILRRYQRRRLASNLVMMGAMEGFKELFGSRSPAVTLIRNVGMQSFNATPSLKTFIINQVVG